MQGTELKNHVLALCDAVETTSIAGSSMLGLTQRVRELCARAMVQPDGWQPIETAPKDTDVILYCKRIGVVCGRWSDERYAGNPRPYWKHDKTHLFGIKQTREDQPTHWMPKPDAPK